LADHPSQRPSIGEQYSLSSSTVYEDIRTTHFGVNPGEHHPQRYRQLRADTEPSSGGDQPAGFDPFEPFVARRAAMCLAASSRLVPELWRHGRFRREYKGSTLHENPFDKDRALVAHLREHGVAVVGSIREGLGAIDRLVRNSH
jgi:hypothetical protein